MSRKVFFTIVAVVYAVLGLGNLLAPGPFMSGSGVSFDPAGDLIARVLGTAAIAFAIIMWACRSALPSPLFAAVLHASIAEKALQVVLVIYAVDAGVFGAAGWVMAIMQGAFGVGFAWFAFRLPRRAVEA